MAPRARPRSPLRLSLQEREEVSRGVQAGESMRAIARRLGRSASTVSRDVAATGGRRKYRAWRAECWRSSGSAEIWSSGAVR
ncbi:helix-turn-helix domain-containing protein [Corallococcus sicarius]|uniref:helix-turn-helix domain-containing protein n=1 Tax=Corallococcus sicarius TaxID=2316726 RepID=UPI001FC982AA|nr:helix-turn-helix domain-containing protein [Corallococcus sicarius]